MSEMRVPLSIPEIGEEEIQAVTEVLRRKWLTMGQETLHMAADWSGYEGIEITGRIQKVFSRGELIINGQECLAEKGRGSYIHCELPPAAM